MSKKQPMAEIIMNIVENNETCDERIPGVVTSEVSLFHFGKSIERLRRPASRVNKYGH